MNINRRTRWIAGAVQLAVCLVALGSTLAAPVQEGQSPTGTVPKGGAFGAAKRLGRGVNIIGYDPIWKDFEKGRFKERHFKLIKEAGFDSVRVNLHALQVMGPAPDYALPAAWLSTLDWAVDKALANGLAVVLDLHNYNDVAQEPSSFKPKLLAFWKQIGTRYKDKPEALVFEVLNEPNGKLNAKLWNEWLPEALAVIRATNPSRTVIVGPPMWNGFRFLDQLVLPEADRNLIVTIHYYDPFPFTHQGASWTPFVKASGVTWGADKERAQLAADFDRIQAWSEKHGRPILLGEFGAYENAPFESRILYTAAVARAAEARGWAWTYWQFDSDFIVYDIDKDGWVEPILKALVPAR
jgi:endoglucanase